MSRLSQASATGNQGSRDFRVLGRGAGTATVRRTSSAEALIEENGQTFVQIQKGDAVERRAVTGARIHGARATLLEGVNEGDVVVLDQSPR